MLDFILCRDFFPKDDLNGIRKLFDPSTMTFEEKEYGMESALQIPFNFINYSMSKILNVPVTIIKSKSGFIRKPANRLIHYEEFKSLKEWCFFVAIEKTTFNLHKHQSGCISALQETNLNYRYTPEWDYYLNVLLEPNQGIFFRPWYFHSIEDGLTANYRFTIDY
jgi:hypothetical protein